MENETQMQDLRTDECKAEAAELPAILEEITMDEMAVDGICGIY